MSQHSTSYCQVAQIQNSLKYRISQPIRRTFSPEKCDLNSTCVLCAEGKYYFQTYNTRTSIVHHLHRGMILVAVTIFWVSVMNKYIMVANFCM
jgi:hypothetical protein